MGAFERMEEACQELMLIKRRSEEQKIALYQASETIKSQSCLKSPNRLQELAGEPEDQFVGDNQIR